MGLVAIHVLLTLIRGSQSDVGGSQRVMTKIMHEISPLADTIDVPK